MTIKNYYNYYLYIDTNNGRIGCVVGWVQLQNYSVAGVYPEIASLIYVTDIFFVFLMIKMYTRIKSYHFLM